VDGTTTVVKEYSSLRPEWLTTFKIFELPTTLASIGFVVSRRHEDPHELAEGYSEGYSMSGPRDLGSGRWLSGAWWQRDGQTEAGRTDLPTLAFDSSESEPST